MAGRLFRASERHLGENLCGNVHVVLISPDVEVVESVLLKAWRKVEDEVKWWKEVPRSGRREAHRRQNNLHLFRQSQPQPPQTSFVEDKVDKGPTTQWKTDAESLPEGMMLSLPLQ